MGTVLRQIKRILYRLKRQFGQEIVYSRNTTNTVNYRTGAITRAGTDVTIKRAIVLPARMIRSFEYDLTYIAANKNFTYGGFYDDSSRLIIVDRKDLKASALTPRINDTVEFNGRSWLVKQVVSLDINYGYALTVYDNSRTPDPV